MTREEFIERLEKERYPYYMEKDGRIIIVYKWDVYLDTLTSLPPGVIFRNGGQVRLAKVINLPPDVEFKNGMAVRLNSITSIPREIEFNNAGDVYLGFLSPKWFSDWKGNIEGIKPTRILNKMIADGLFDKKR